MFRGRAAGILVGGLAVLGLGATGGPPEARPEPPASVSAAAQACESEPLSTSGTIYYVCDCKPGAAPGCQPGRDESSGRTVSSPWRTLAKAVSEFPKLRAGDTLAFCRGGVFEGGGDFWFNTNCRANRPCRIRDYTPRGQSAQAPAPRLHTSLNISNGGNARHKEGVRVSNLTLEGNGSGVGVALFNDAKDIFLCNLTVQNYNIGVYPAGANLPDPGSDGFNARIVLRGSRVLHNKSMGWLGACDDCRIESNLFDHNGDANMADHSIYVNDANSRIEPEHPARGMQVVGNEIYHSSQGEGPICQGAPIVVHGSKDGLVIRGNFISQDLGTAGGGCWGIMLSANYKNAEGFRNVTVSGNTVRNVGNTSIHVQDCQGCVVENNLIIQAQPAFGARGINVQRNSEERLPRMLVGTAATVRNNTIYFSTSEPSDGVIVGGEGRDHVIAGNVVVQSGSGRLNCFDYDLPPAAYYSDHNFCWNANKGSTSWQARAKTLGAWQGASGLDAHSSFADPLFVRMGWKEYDFSPAPRSPLIHAGDPAHSPPSDLLGRPRPVQPGAGALDLP
jgi:parallel beta-helix repeat protein